MAECVESGPCPGRPCLQEAERKAQGVGGYSLVGQRDIGTRPAHGPAGPRKPDHVDSGQWSLPLSS